MLIPDLSSIRNRRFPLIFACLAFLSHGVVAGPPAVRAPEVWECKELGHVFQAGEPVELVFKTDAESVNWKITDFWHKDVETGSANATGGQAVIKPKTTTIGYYLLNAVPVKGGATLPDSYTSFAIVRLHVSKDPLNSPFGAMTHFAQGMNPEILPALKKIGIEAIRDEHYWAQVEQAKGVYQFAPKSDAYMEACKKVGVNPLIAMTFGNKLYDDKDGPSTQAGFEGYGNYGQAILKKYGSQIHWLEVWNEYNGTWAPPSAKKSLEARYTTYTTMLKVAYQKIKAVRPDVQVLGGASVLIPLPYFEGIFKLGGLNFMDAVVIHPYRERPEGVDVEVEGLKALIRKYNDGKDKPIWVTETGRHTLEEFDWERGRKMYEKGRAEGARYLARQYTLLLKENVTKIFWYLSSDHLNFVSMGLLRNHQNEASGMGLYAVAPAYVSYANLIALLDGAQFVRREAWREYTRTQVNLFKRGNEEIRVCWATQPSKIRIKTAQPLTVVNLMGAESTAASVNGEVTLDLTEDATYVLGHVSDVSEVDTGVHVLASSADDYSKTQGENNWYYGYICGDTPFTELKQVETMWGYNWGGATQYMNISAGSMHPDKIKGQDAMPTLRWKSPVDGKLTVKGKMQNDGKGDGIFASIRVDNKEVYNHHVGGVDPKKVEIEVPIEVKKGSFVDFSISPGPSTSFDATGYEFTIIQGQTPAP